MMLEVIMQNENLEIVEKEGEATALTGSFLLTLKEGSAVAQ